MRYLVTYRAADAGVNCASSRMRIGVYVDASNRAEASTAFWRRCRYMGINVQARDLTFAEEPRR